MPFAEHYMLSGTITATQTGTLPVSVNVNCGFLPTKIMITNETEWGITNTGNENIQQMFWDSTNPTQTNVTFINAAGTALVPSVVTSNGISQYNGQIAAPGANSLTFGAAVTGGALSKANPAQLTSTAHGLQTGDQIIIQGPFTAATAMNQLGGIIFSVTFIDANTVSIPVDTTGANFTATTVTTWRKVTVPPYYYPRAAVITKITAANPMVVTTSTNHGLTVGQQVRIRVPAVFGMTQANNITGVITAVTTTTFTLGSVDASAFTAFAWPAVTSIPFSFAQVIPEGSGPTATTFLPATQFNFDPLDDATDNQSFQGFTVGTGVLKTSAAGTVGITASDVLSWTAWRGDV